MTNDKAGSWNRLLLAVGLIGAFFFLVAVADHLKLYRLQQLILVAALYLALAAAFLGAALLLGRWGWPGILFGGTGLAGLALWHVREQTDLIHFNARMLSSCLAFALFVSVAVALLRFLRNRKATRRAIVLLVSGLLGALLVVAGAFVADSRLHWHLVRHHRIVAATLQGILLEPIPELTQVFFEPVRWVSSPKPPTEVEVRSSDDAQEKPHIVVILVDTLRADALSAWGGSPKLMPRLNAWSERSYVLRDVIANASWTSPSVASLFTGLLPEQHGLWDNRTRLAEGNVTLAEVFRERGYRTLAVITNSNAGAELGFDQGFERFLHPKGERSYARADRVRRIVLRQIRELPLHEEPLFLYIHLMEPHAPYLSGETPSSWQPYHHRPAYEAELSFLDEQLDELIQSLHRILPSPRVLLVTSDHGEEFGEHGDHGHGHSLYQELLHVPTVIQTGDDVGSTGSTIHEPLELRDLFDFLVTYEPGRSTHHWARQRARRVRCASTYSTPKGLASLYMLRPYAQHRLRAAFQDEEVLIWSGFGPYLEKYDLETDPRQIDNLLPESIKNVAPVLSYCTPWAKTPTFGEKSEELIDELEALGYAQ